MNIIKKTMFIVLLALSPIASQSAFADGASDVQVYCSNCHGLTVNGVVVAGNGGRIGTQRPAAEWVLNFERMNAVGAGVPVNLMAGMADYLASIPPIATTSTSTSSTTTSTTSTSTTTSTTTLCNTYVNGTTQYPSSGKGSCHSFAIDDMSGEHIVRDQAYCKKHMSHFNSKGNHVHAYPHPMCM